MSESGVTPPPEDRAIREIGRMLSRYGLPIEIGINKGDVSIRVGRDACILLGRMEREQFSRLYFEAERQAEASGE